MFGDVTSQRDLSFLNENFELFDVECSITNTLYSCVQECLCKSQRSNEVDMQVCRWERSLSDRDNSWGWKAINREGEFAGESSDKLHQSNDEFEAHFEAILNSDINNHDIMEITTDVTVPVLDEQVSAAEVQEQIQGMPDGLPPGVFSCCYYSGC